MRRLLSFIAALLLLGQPAFGSGFSSTASAGGGATTSALTVNNSGSGAASGSTFNGSTPVTVSTNSLGALKASNNLSDVTAATARTNLGLGTAATLASDTDTSLTANSDTSIATQKAIKGYVDARAPHPGYVSGNWYAPFNATVTTGTAPSAGSIRLLPFTITKALTPSALGVRITTLSASGNVQLAIYANNAATGHPTGTALCSTASITTGATGAVSATASCPQLLGTFWAAMNQDNSTAVYQTLASGSTIYGALIGSATLTNISSGATGAVMSLSVAQTFGTWPDLTSASFTENSNNQASAIVYMKAQ